MKKNYRTVIFAAWAGIILFPLLYPFDHFAYPEHKFKLLTTRIIIMAILVITPLLPKKIVATYPLPVSAIGIFFASLCITIQCFITGGFSSHYYVGQLGLFIVMSCLYFIKPRDYCIILISCLLQHFILLFFVPFDLIDLMKNIFFLGLYSGATLIVHYVIYNLTQEVKVLKGYLPICSKCKKIRDDKGNWNQMEQYITERSEAQFSHSLCPECSDNFMKDSEKYFR